MICVYMHGVSHTGITCTCTDLADLGLWVRWSYYSHWGQPAITLLGWSAISCIIVPAIRTQVECPTKELRSSVSGRVSKQGTQVECPTKELRLIVQPKNSGRVSNQRTQVECPTKELRSSVSGRVSKQGTQVECPTKELRSIVQPKNSDRVSNQRTQVACPTKILRSSVQGAFLAGLRFQFCPWLLAGLF